MEFELTETKQEAPGTKSFRFTLLSGQLTYKPGQYISMRLGVEDPRGPTRSFSIASSPTESDSLMICTRISNSPFKQKLNSTPVGAKVTIHGPSGRFLLPEDASGHVALLGGGIGITPFRSMIKFATDNKLSTKITLLYSNKIPQEIVFREELENCQSLNENLRVVNTITRPEESMSVWEGRTGRIDENLIREFAPDSANCVFYACGPPAMVDAMVQALRAVNIPEEKIKQEKFTGY